ncbi:DUF1232 domain-containing protein [Apibacter raozihei]|uniref:YkvA family protein n=1 Tax=Apibacter raozihei TaxID=2500547 RepID=UPI000FE2A484|nr:DUF1232 domain-containing protein [Apibacter raozihei]
MKVKMLLGILMGNKKFVSKFPDLFRMLKTSLSGNYKPGIKNIFIFTFLIFYIISPIDLIPGFFVGIGILDDITIAFFAMSKLFKEVDKFREWEKQKNAVFVIK